ncbi:MAG: acyl-CoA thioesterase [Gloeocapsa sp. UFS-A4-WI-NPMV-4B04]|jgi:1,4-dihydroxy-2-naphthoyl-CoA hydrolase|nr:acyl-CoA thioesterase [Gloeocapsa sp. UFS-A4-WI-NPMV-4B04]
MLFSYQRIIRFQDTDAAGVVYFANVLGMCHEAYEESLAASGINLKTFFSNSDIAIPIVHANVDFFRPMFCGDKISICLVPQQITNEKFEVTYELFGVAKEIYAKAITRHVCINPINRNKEAIPDDIIRWLDRKTNCFHVV